MDQPWVHMCPPSRIPSHLPPHPIHQGRPRALALSTLHRASFTALSNPLSKAWIMGHPLLYPLVSPLSEVSSPLVAWIVISTQNTPKCKYSAFLSRRDFPGGSDGKTSAYSVGEPGSSPGSGRSPGEGNGNPFQYSCLENPMDGGAWQTIVHGVPKNWTQLSNFTFFLLSYLNVSPELPFVCSAYPSEYKMDINVHFSSVLLWQICKNKSFYFKASKKLLCCV